MSCAKPTIFGLIATLAIACGPVAIPPTSSATGTNAYSIDDVGLWIKSEYHLPSPATPPYITNQPSIIPVAQLHTLFTSRKYPIDVRKTDYLYCNLPAADWIILRGQTPTKFPVLWDSKPDSTGGRLVLTVDFKTDLFAPAPMTGPQFTNELLRRETAIRRATGRTNFLLLGKSEG